MAYDFSTLNDKELEEISRDLLNRKLKMDFQDFKVGKDKGIDLRYSSSKNKNSQIVQVKHYLKSGFEKLIYHLEKVELPKVKALSPDKYYVVTSLELSAQQKDDIYKLFNPYIKSPNDIFGQEDLNKYLQEFSDIEKKWFKLWLTSTDVLNSILHNGILGKSAFAEMSIRKKIKLYVQSKSYTDSTEILNTHKYILITGQPGVGKTTLANLLTYQLLADGFQLIYVDGDIKEAEALFDNDPTKKQVFYFDDFLGSSYLELTNPKITESGIVNFLERIKASTDKYLILTTRTIILRNALSKYEKLNRARIDLARKEIELGNYTELEKAQILYNHLFHSDLADDYREEIFKNKNYWKVISHQNYYPRLIEFFTTPINLKNVPAKDYFEFVMKNLENPEEVWRYAYEQQLIVEERMLLHSIFSQPYFTDINKTKSIFDSLLQTEITKYGYRPQPNPFTNSCKRLLDGIIKKENHVYRDNHEILNFINPSINDFLINYFITNAEERWKLISSLIYVEQFERITEALFDNFKHQTPHREIEMTKLVSHILANLSTFKLLTDLQIEENLELYKKLRLYAFLSKLNTTEDLTDRVDSETLSLLKTIIIENLNRESKGIFIKLIRRCKYEGLVFGWVKENWQKIIEKIIEMSSDEDDFNEVINIFDEFEEDYEAFISDDANYKLFYEIVEEYVNSMMSDWISDEDGNVYNEDDWEKMKDNIADTRSDFFRKYELEDDNYWEGDYFNDSDYQNLIGKNEEKRMNTESDRDYWKDMKLMEEKPIRSSHNAIDDLFSR